MKKALIMAALAAAVLTVCGGREAKDKQTPAAVVPDTAGTVSTDTAANTAIEAPEVSPSDVSSNPDSIVMVFVEGGTFTMGCTEEQGDDCDSREKPAHNVTLSRFYLGKYEITQGQWKAVTDSNPSIFTGNDNLPVDFVSWDDVQEFIRKLNAKTGKKYRLPTNAEWEYAARGGNRSKGYKYPGSNTPGDVAWYCADSSHEDEYEDMIYYGGNSGMKTHLAGTKQPNELGIYDMGGNVSEWVNDWYGTYNTLSETDPQGPPSGILRVYRGCAYASGVWHCVASDRFGSAPNNRSSSYGFRLALDP